MVYKAKKSRGSIIGLVAGLLMFSFVFWGIEFGLGPGWSGLKISLFLPAVLFALLTAYLIFGSFTIRYEVADKELVLGWGTFRKRVPWEEFTEIHEVIGEANLFPFLGVQWPGYIAGLYTFKGFGPIRIFGTKWEDGFIYLKSKRGFFGLTPEDAALLQIIADKTGLPVQPIKMSEVPKDVKGKSLKHDNVFSMYHKMNVIALIILFLYVGIFYPITNCNQPFVILLLVLALALYFFNVSNAARLVQFNAMGGYLTLLMGVMITGAFLIMSFAVIHLNV